MTDPNNPPPPPPYGAVPPAAPYGSAPQAAPYGSAPGAPYYAPTGPPTNIIAILALVAVFVFAPAAIVLGHIGLAQTKRTGEAGHQLALWGMILGYVFTAGIILLLVGSFILPFIIVALAAGSGVYS